MKEIEKKGGRLVTGSGGLDLQAMRKRRTGLQPVRERAGGGKLQLLMMFDITGSMFEYFDLVRSKLSYIAGFVKREVPSAQFAVFAYRNHGDERRYSQIYYTSPFNMDIEAVRSVIGSIKKGGGGRDALTCMEDCFREANRLPWVTSSSKAIVVVGDMPPHGVLDSMGKCPKGIDYRHEVGEFMKKGVKVYPVFAGYRDTVREFFRKLAADTGGRFLEISDIDALTDLLIGICMKETGNLPRFLEGLRKNRQLTGDKERLLLTLK